MLASCVFLAVTPFLLFAWTHDRKDYDKPHEKEVNFIAIIIVVYSCRFLSLLGVIGGCLDIVPLIFAYSLIALVLLLPLTFLLMYSSATWGLLILFIILAILLLLSGIYGFLLVRSLMV